ncbi:hypothetical protein [Streptomyces sp. NPDC091027]|uniref:hypothetical protein n=1 Tax=Streptomyces sp. NPDC091027 TaxID=3365971 RepID=UPI00382B1379
MLVNCDGVTPLPRMLLIDWFLLRPDFRVQLHTPVFAAAGDRLSYEDDTLMVTRPDGERRRHAVRDSHWICR